MPKNERNRTRKARLEKGAAKKVVLKALEAQNKAALKNEEYVLNETGEVKEVIPAGPIKQFIYSQDPTLRLARIVSKVRHNVFTIQFSENGQTMQGEYTGKTPRSLTRKQKNGARKGVDEHLLPGAGSYVIVKWDEAHAKINAASRKVNKKHRTASANIVAIIPKDAPATLEKAQQVANRAARRAGNATLWELDDLFEREDDLVEDSSDEEEEDEEEEEEEDEEEQAEKVKMSNSVVARIKQELQGKKKKKKRTFAPNDNSSKPTSWSFF